jgi:hypothetical protein
MIYIYQKTKELQPETITAHLAFYFILFFHNDPDCVFPDVDCDMRYGMNGYVKLC